MTPQRVSRHTGEGKDTPEYQGVVYWIKRNRKARKSVLHAAESIAWGRAGEIFLDPGHPLSMARAALDNELLQLEKRRLFLRDHIGQAAPQKDSPIGGENSPARRQGRK